MRPALPGDQAKAEPSKIVTWVQHLRGVNTKGDGGIGDVDHPILLSKSLINVVDVAIRRIPARVELLAAGQRRPRASREAAYKVLEICQSREAALKCVMSICNGGEKAEGSEQLHVELKERETNCKKGVCATSCGKERNVGNGRDEWRKRDREVMST